ncbi:hypothetical protein PHLGIDRAFT_288230 [Phlebiopsis gigantea 11061_1 CR5-6]|uniref:Uncharacterized protein n=1 Tax=Phlebiopsis gigantea (strain 11061_1 CR5-6) TaxID=745531 RepID=A0A0C3SBB3_PHLG1|nr:hypothetical protein PHLGIDRAFT_288230 [Phlebiopsis gigantea 11061_1 CR5-6]
MIETSFDQHAAALTAMVPDIAGQIQGQLLQIVSGTALQFHQLELQARSVEMVWGDLNRNVAVMQDSVTTLIAGASEASTRLAVHSSQAALAQQTQQDAIRSAAALASSLGELANRTREEMHAINATASAVREELVSAKANHAMFTPPWWTGWSDYGAAWLLQTVFGVDQPNQASFMHLPVVRIGSVFVRLACYLLRAGIASVMVCLTLHTLSLAVSMTPLNYFCDGKSSALLLLSLSRWLSTSIVPWNKMTRLSGTTGTFPLPPQMFALPPPRLAASLPPRAASATPLDNGPHRRRFSRIPERLLRPL